MEFAMKGPRSRHKFYIVRQWECPLCKKQASSPLSVVNRACTCQGVDRPTWMRLVEEGEVRSTKSEVR